MKQRIRKGLVVFVTAFMLINVAGIKVYGEEETIKISEQFPDEVFQEIVMVSVGASSVDEDVNISVFNNLKVIDYVGKDKSRVKSIDGIEVFRNLEKLWINDNDLTELPESIGNLTQLRGLYVYNNKLTSLPESIGNLTQLRRLYAYGNKLTSLPECIENLENLEILSLGYNHLTELPESIGNLTQLQELYGYNNNLTSLPESIGNLTNLAELHLDYNQLTTLPESIWGITTLERLDLRNNALSDITWNQVIKSGWNWSSVENQIYDLPLKGAVDYSYHIKMTTFMKSSNVDDFALKKEGLLYHADSNEMMQLDQNDLNFEDGMIVIPKEMLQETGYYELYIYNQNSGNVYFVYKFEITTIEELDLTFEGIPSTIFVGDTFTVTPSRDNQQGSIGWEWNEDIFDATFNSPATFTAKDSGITTIKYTTVEGYVIAKEVEVKEQYPWNVDFDANGGSGDLASFQLYFNEEVKLSKSTMTRPDYRFTGWSYDKEATKSAHADEEVFKLDKREDKILYAVWEAIKIQISEVPTNLVVGDVFTLKTNIKGTWNFDATMFEAVNISGNSIELRALKAVDATLEFQADNGEVKEISVSIQKNKEISKPSTKESVSTGDDNNMIMLLAIMGISLFVLKRKNKSSL